MTENGNITKEEILSEIAFRIENKIIEEESGKFLIKLINKAETVDEMISIYQLGTNYTRTGLHYQYVNEKLTDTIKYFSKDEDLSFCVNPNRPTHKLIIGDNYPSLQNLLIQYRSGIDVIYIDPPYGKDSMGEFAETNYNNALTRDNLLSMMHSRLLLARDLLSEKGVIFVSIDDKNMAYIKCLLDSIFGEKSFICSMPRQSRGSATTKSDSELQVLHDYVLLYCKNYSYCEFNKEIKGQKKYPFHDERGDFYAVPLQDNGPGGTRTARPNLYYPIFYNPITKDFSLEKINDDYIEYLPHRHKNDDGRWMWSKKKFETDKNDLTIIDEVVKIKHYFNPKEDQNKYEQFKTWLAEFQNAKGTKMLNSILGKGLFDNPKPVELISWLLNIATDDDSVVLDFFAGSGTTGQALLELNKNKNMKFILVQLDEDLDESIKTATETAANTIKHQIEFLDSLNRPHMLSEITCERLRRVMTGKTFEGKTDFEWAEKNQPFNENLDVIRICSVSNKEQRPGKSAFDLIDETLYGKLKFESKREKIEWVVNNFEHCQKIVEDK